MSQRHWEESTDGTKSPSQFGLPKILQDAEICQTGSNPSASSLGVLRPAKDIRQKRMGVASAGDGIQVRDTIG